MNKLLMVLALVTGPVLADDWSKSDTLREVTVLTLFVADWRQTRDSITKPGYTEINPILGEKPSAKEVNTYFGVMALAHVGASYFLPRKWREGFQYTTIGYEAGVVFRNNRIGLSVNF